MKIQAGAPIKSIQVEAVILRADGRVEPLGTIDYWHRNPFKRVWFRITQFWRARKWRVW